MNSDSKSVTFNQGEINKTNDYYFGNIFQEVLSTTDSMEIVSYTSFKADEIALIKVDAFKFDKKLINLNPPLEFSARFNREVSLWELEGVGLYASVLLSANSIVEIYEELVEEILPFLWRVYVLNDDVNLSHEAKSLKFDLLRRA